MLADLGDGLYDRNAGTITLWLLALMLVATEVGFRLGHRALRRGEPAAHPQLGAIQAAVLALLGLLLAFTFSLAEGRHDARKQVVVEEANAIGTAYLRASLLEDPDRRAIESTLRLYLDARLAFYRASFDDRIGLESARARSQELEQAAWARTATLGREKPSSVTTGLLLHALNELIDVHAKQDMAFEYHVPASVLSFFFALSILTLGIVGYNNGVTAARHFGLTSALILMSALVLYVIMDLDRPRRGLIQIGEQSLAGLQNAIAREP